MELSTEELVELPVKKLLEFPIEKLWDIMLRLDYMSLLSICQTSKTFADICSNLKFWKAKISYDNLVEDKFLSPELTNRGKYVALLSREKCVPGSENFISGIHCLNWTYEQNIKNPSEINKNLLGYFCTSLTEDLYLNFYFIDYNRVYLTIHNLLLQSIIDKREDLFIIMWDTVDDIHRIINLSPFYNVYILAYDRGLNKIASHIIEYLIPHYPEKLLYFSVLYRDLDLLDKILKWDEELEEEIEYKDLIQDAIYLTKRYNWEEGFNRSFTPMAPSEEEGEYLEEKAAELNYIEKLEKEYHPLSIKISNPYPLEDYVMEDIDELGYVIMNRDYKELSNYTYIDGLKQSIILGERELMRYFMRNITDEEKDISEVISDIVHEVLPWMGSYLYFNLAAFNKEFVKENFLVPIFETIGEGETGELGTGEGMIEYELPPPSETYVEDYNEIDKEILELR